MRSPRKILIPTDLSACSFEALEYAEDISRLFTTDIILLHAIDRCDHGGKPKTRSEIDEEEFEVRKGLIHALMERHIVPRNLKIEIVPGDAVEAIVAAVRRFQIDLVIICTHGRTGWQHALIGSVTEKVVRLCPVPVVVVKGEETERADIYDTLRFHLHLN